jgi:hypothetical protein
MDELSLPMQWTIGRDWKNSNCSLGVQVKHEAAPRLTVVLLRILLKKAWT